METESAGAHLPGGHSSRQAGLEAKRTLVGEDVEQLISNVISTLGHYRKRVNLSPK